MKILVTGANGFIGKNLIASLENIRDGKDKTYNLTRNIEIFKYDVDNTEKDLEQFCTKCDFVFNLAGVNRPKNDADYMKGNYDFGRVLLDNLKKAGNKCPIMLASSIQAEIDNPYGLSKRAGELVFKEYSDRNNIDVYIYRFQNVFGKWCKPNYNSVIATFCYNIANELPIVVNNVDTELNLIYIDDLVDNLLQLLSGVFNRNADGFCEVQPVHKVKLGKIAELLKEFARSRALYEIPIIPENSFEKKLYSTFLTYLPKEKFLYNAKMNTDSRGSFTELFKSNGQGQVSINISKPGITKGEHWHHSKNEKFAVVAGHGLIRLRKIDESKVVEYEVFGDNIKIVDMIPGYTHSIVNLSKTDDLVTVIWCNECFDAKKPDTFALEVGGEK